MTVNHHTGYLWLDAVWATPCLIGQLLTILNIAQAFAPLMTVFTHEMIA